MKSKKQKMEDTSNVSFEFLSPFKNPNLKYSNEDELKGHTFLYSICAKPDWTLKIQKSEIVRKWIREAKEADIKQEIIEKILQTLYKFSQLDTPQIIKIFRGIYQVDHLISEALKKEFLENLRPLEYYSLKVKDYHPGSNEKVLNLVHPSLYCFLLKYSNQCKEKINQRKTSMKKWPILGLDFQEKIKKGQNLGGRYNSADFQWLPSEFSVAKDGKVSIESYINNLNPLKFGNLYSSIEKIFEKFVPLFERVLTDIQANQDETDSEEDDLTEKEDDYDEKRNKNKSKAPKDINVEKIFTLKNQEKIETISLKGMKLQVIVKISSIIINPDHINPLYDGGVWHIEGMKNESIVATGIYYYDCENIANSLLEFRKAIPNPEEDEEYDFEQNSGIPQMGILNQNLGYVGTIKDRCIAFPNIYQHKVSSFNLKDSSQNGTRKILVFFLVDPSKTIISTKNVLPQQKEWIDDILFTYRSFGKDFPLELIQNITSFLPLLDFDKASKYRLNLMKERKKEEKYINGRYEEQYRPVNLCEH